MNYSFEETWQSTWMFSNHIHRQCDREEFVEFEDPETTHAAKFRVTCRLPNGKYASLKQRIITRRFMEDDRVVIVWKSFIAGDGSLRGIQTDETGWGIIRPSLTGQGTMMQVCVKHVPLHLNGCCPASEPVMSKYNNVLENVAKESDREITSGAESLLLEDALTGIHKL
ncbi:hypothetical protein ON010_g17203 [Phytophthora cinnamomi]|nr:hypothetical protein ON010_g17203 [Phytophthora cinnamomi]